MDTTYRLGREPTAQRDLDRRLFLRDFYKAPSGLALPVRDAIDWHAKSIELCPANGLDDPLGNNDYGDCVFAAVGHTEQMASACESKQPASAITAKAIVAAYFDFTGGRDGGANLGQVLKLWQKSGICGSKLHSYLAIDPTDHEMLMWSCDYLGGLFVACDCARSWVGNQKLWDAGAGRSAGGHCVVMGGYNSIGPWITTWGYKVQCTWAGWAERFDESYAVILDTWTAGGNKPSPAGLDLTAIEQQVAIVQAA